MKRVFLAVVVAACALRSGAAGTRDELKTSIEGHAAAWNRGDLEGFCAAYTDDVTFISPTGLTQGRQAVLDRYRTKYVNKAGMGRLLLDIVEVREIGTDNASVIARWSLAWPDKPKAEGLTLIVFTRTKAGWRIMQDASM